MFTTNVRSPIVRVLLLLSLVIVLGWLSWMILRLAIGDSFVTFARRATEVSDEARFQAIAAATRYAADDPFTRYQSGLVYFNASETDESGKSLKNAITELRAAAQMNPEDYRVWLALGRALGRSAESGATAEARQPLERAVQLAPRHFDPRWTLGNLLLRSGERDAACEAFRIAMNNRPDTARLIFDALWQAYQNDAKAILRALNAPRESSAQLALALVAYKQIPEAMALWKQADQTPGNTQQMTQALLAGQFHTAAFEVWSKAAGNDLPPRDQDSLLSNGGFDREITLGSTEPFLTWQIQPRNGLTLSLDGQQTHSGLYCLRTVFNSKDSDEFMLASQCIPVTPSTNYRFRVAVRTEELKSFSLPVIEVVDPASTARLTVSVPKLESTQPAWKEHEIAFTTSPETQAVVIRIRRPACAESPCPLTGHAWFDSFNLTQASTAKSKS